MKELNLNFGKLYWEMFQDERLVELSNDGIILYTKMLDKMNLSKSRKYVDKNGEVYILFTQEEALKKCRIKQRTFFTLKKQLKKLGLIHYDEQKVKKTGVSTPIYVKHYELWSKEYVVEESTEGTSDNLNNNDYIQQPENYEPKHETVGENIEILEVLEENMTDNKQNVLEESIQGLEDSSNDTDINIQQNGFGITEINTSDHKSKIENKEPSDDRKMVYVKSNQYGQMIEVYRYDKGIKDNLFKWAERKGMGIDNYLKMVERKYSATINYI